MKANLFSSLEKKFFFLRGYEGSWKYEKLCNLQTSNIPALEK